MKILVLNCGSSSVKYKLIDTAGDVTMAEGGVEKIGLDDGFLKFKRNDGSKEILNLGNTDHKGAVSAILNLLTDAKEGCIASFAEIDAVGHRVVHGGEKFNKSVLITSEVIDKVKECYDIAPLHNPANITGIEAISALMPDVPQVAVFDTAFHQTMPAKSYLYALPYKYYKEDGVRDQTLMCSYDADGNTGVNMATSTDYTNWKAINRFTLGLGFNYKKMFLDLAYQYSTQDGDFYPFMSSKNFGTKEGFTPAISNEVSATKVSNNRHQLLMTLGYKF